MTDDSLAVVTYGTPEEIAYREGLYRSLVECPIPGDQVLASLALFLDSKHLARILCLDFLYRQIVEVQGCIMEFGVRWGPNLALFIALRSMYEPFNRHRKIIGFDTFSGIPCLHDKDRLSDMIKIGGLNVTSAYEHYLYHILALHEKLNPLSHIRKFDLCKGDVNETLPAYLAKNPYTILSLVFMDLDLYQPTRVVLEMLKTRLTKGSIVAFDQVNDLDCPGETLALMDAIGLNQVRLRRFRFASRISYFVVE